MMQIRSSQLKEYRTHNLCINWPESGWLHHCTLRRISVFLECYALAVFVMFILKFCIHSLRNAATY